MSILIVFVLAGVLLFSVALDSWVAFLKSSWMLLDNVVVGSGRNESIGSHILFIVKILLTSFDVHLSDLHPLLLLHLLAIEILVFRVVLQLGARFSLFIAVLQRQCRVSVAHSIIGASLTVIFFTAALVVVIILLSFNNDFIGVNAVVEALASGVTEARRRTLSLNFELPLSILV